MQRMAKDYKKGTQKSCSVRRMIMVTTNRFDFVVTDRPEYYSLIKTLSRDARIDWIANNPWEPRYAQYFLGGQYLDVFIPLLLTYPSTELSGRLGGHPSRPPKLYQMQQTTPH